MMRTGGEAWEGLEAERTRRRITFVGFLLGLPVGFAALMIVGFIAGGLSNAMYPKLHLEISGADVSRHSGTRISLSGQHIDLKCNDECDSIVYANHGMDNTFELRIVNAKQECVLCSRGNIFSRGLALNWSVAGHERLQLKPSPNPRD